MAEFKDVTLVVLGSTEQQSLRETIRLLLENCDIKDIRDIVIFLISSDCPSAAVAEEIAKDPSIPVTVRVAIQKTPGLSPAIYEISRLQTGSHFLVIASDLEMDPLSVPEMIEEAKKHPDAIICASKFKNGARREGYGLIHYLCNRAVNFAVEKILNIHGSELIATFQIYPKDLCDKMHFDDPDRAFYEFTIRPVSMGVEYIELPTNYKPRTDGESTFNLKKYINLGTSFISTAIHERRRLKTETEKSPKSK